MVIFGDLISYLGLLLPPLFFGLIVSGIFLKDDFIKLLLFTPLKKMSFSQRNSKLTIIVFLTVLIVWLGLTAVFNHQVRLEIKNFIEKSSEQSTSIIINNKRIRYNKKLLNELINYKDIEPHHSYHDYKIPILLVNDSDSLEIHIYKDSQIKNEYWVFFPKYRITRINEIGHLKTNEFDQW